MNKRLKKKQKRKAEKGINNLNRFFKKHEKEIKKLDREIKELNISTWKAQIDYRKK